MCGIVGFTHLERPLPPGLIQKATASLHHRGPDASGCVSSESVSLGAVRLKIIDLQHGDQPMCTEDGDLTIAFNGEIYNHAEIRRDLELLGHRFRSHCDTEVVLRAFREWDTAAFAKLNGMFGVALHQRKQKRLVLARDRMGIKPLYYFRKADNLFFGSELKAILENPEVPRRLNRQALDLYLSLNYVPSPHTLIEGIVKLPPGHWLEWSGGKLDVQPYWSLALAAETTWVEEEALVYLDRLLKTAVSDHMMADVPLGVWSSGGIDSSTILHYASQASSKRLKTFSVSFRGHSHDETPYFRAAAQHYNTEHHELDLNPQDHDLADAIEQMSYYSDEPSADAGALPVWFLSKMTRQHVTVALTGDGADELFAGYQTYLANAFRRYASWTPTFARSAALQAMKYWPASDKKIGLDYKIKRFLGGSLLSANEAHFFWNGSLSLDQKHELLGRDGFQGPLQLLSQLPAQAHQSGELNRFLWMDQKFYLVDDILYKCDRMSMAHSLELRPPFLDPRIVDFASRLPENLKMRRGNLKYLLKELMRDKLPPPLLARKKEGFDIPAHAWFRGPLRHLLQEILSERRIREQGLFQPAAVSRMIEGHYHRKANHGYQLWGLLTLTLWMQRWNVQVDEA
jgi:asparagine synthase (glutamine-hydrolysing)